MGRILKWILELFWGQGEDIVKHDTDGKTFDELVKEGREQNSQSKDTTNNTKP